MAASSPHYKGVNILGQTVIEEKDHNGNHSIKFQPQALEIIWGADPRYWRISKYPEVGPVELLQVSWLQVSGSIGLDQLKEGKEYTVSFMVAMKPDAFGWADSPVYLVAKVGKTGRTIWKKADLSRKGAGDPFSIPLDSVLKFTVPQGGGTTGEKLVFGMYEIWRGRWKGGLILHEVVIEHSDSSRT